jgi:hypothetical protein
MGFKFNGDGSVVGFFLEQVAGWYIGVFGGGSRRVLEGEGEGVFLRNLSKDLFFCVAASLEGIGFKVDGDKDRGVAGFWSGRLVKVVNFGMAMEETRQENKERVYFWGHLLRIWVWVLRLVEMKLIWFFWNGLQPAM